jgi:hypothetical protein
VAVARAALPPIRSQRLYLLGASATALFACCLVLGTAVVPGAGAKTASGAFSTEVTNNYAINFAITSSQQGSDTNTPYANTVWSDSLQWSASWKKVPFKILYEHAGDVSFVGGDGSGGTIQASEDFSYMDPPNIVDATDCSGDVPSQSDDDGDVSVDSDGGETFIALADSSTTTFLAAEQNQVTSQCQPDSFAVSTNPDTFAYKGPQGVDFDELGVLGRDWAAPVIGPKAFPFSSIVAKRSFTIDTGIQTQSTDDGSVTEHVVVTFKFLSSKPSPPEDFGGGGGGAGATACHVPELKGLTLATTRIRLKAASCRLGKVTATSSAPQSTLHVTAQSPKADVTKPSGSAVDVTLG